MHSTPRPHPYLTRVRTADAPAGPVPVFPPHGVVLHPDDAASKVFHAVARAFVSVDNRAMTIKDIADRATRYGLVCQNLSAAAQAVTTYLRAHKARCDRQQDQPLLLSHTLSGTPADDDLVPALFSRTGGDSALPSEGRLTNFRKGTAVWYLSRATGVSCPFTRAGIRLCDYVQHDEDPILDKGGRRDRERRDVSCGLKRKRPLRGCVRRDSEDEPDSEEQRPPKVKLTLRLKPLLPKTTPPVEQQPEGTSAARPIDVSESDEDASDESMPVDSSDDNDPPAAQVSNETEEAPWCLPPYPRPSMSIPSYTPSTEFLPSYPTSTDHKDPLRRSPSVPFATPPPDSDDEADDFHVSMTNIKDFPEVEDDNDIGWDADLDSEGEEEGETVWESPGPRSPSAPLIHLAQITVKEEPRDVQGMLDAWEDFDTSVAVAEVLSKALETEARPQVKLEPVDPWDWDTNHAVEWASEDPTHIKQEDFGVDSLFPSGPSSSSPLSPLSSLASQFAAFSYSDAQPGSEPDDDIVRDYPTVRPRAKTVPAPSPFFPTSSSVSPPPPLTRLSMPSSAPSREPSVPSTALVTLLQSMSVNTSAPPAAFTLSAPTPCVSPLQTRCQPTFPLNRPVVVTTCQPCKPAISATQIEEISVYQMLLGAFQLLRRIDTDFVNLAPILAIAGAALSANEIPPNAMVVTKGSPEICGTWVPLAAAQEYVQKHLAGKCAEGELDALRVFLSDTLVERFPQALQDFHRATPARGFNHFGPPFTSTLQAARWEAVMEGGSSALQAHVGGSGSGSSSGSTPGSLMAAGSLSPSSSPPAMLPARPFLLGIGDRHVEKDAPLSATEQQLFHELCVIPDWDREGEGEEGTLDVEMAAAAPPPSPPALISLVTDLSPPPSLAPTSPLSVLSESPLSSPMSSPTITSARPVSAVVRKRTESTETQKPLRRSKRVADAQLAQPIVRSMPARTRGRKGAASRNSLS